MKRPTVQVQLQLSEILTDTLHALGRKRATAGELQIPGVSRNAINNRLESLRRLGFVQRERRGKFWVYSRVPAQQPDPICGNCGFVFGLHTGSTCPSGKTTFSRKRKPDPVPARHAVK